MFMSRTELVSSPLSYVRSSIPFSRDLPKIINTLLWHIFEIVRLVFFKFHEMVNCCVPGCANYSAKRANVGFHTIPSDEQRRKAWLERIRRINMPPLQYSYVCSDRFSASCYQSNLQSKITGQRYKRWLKEDAVPSIFDYASQSNTKRPRLSSENRRDRRMH